MYSVRQVHLTLLSLLGQRHLNGILVVSQEERQEQQRLRPRGAARAWYLQKADPKARD